MALEMAYRIERLAKILVDRPRQVAIVNGLNRYLGTGYTRPTTKSGRVERYPAAIKTPSHLIFFRVVVCSLPETDSAEFEIVIKALAFRRSISE